MFQQNVFSLVLISKFLRQKRHQVFLHITIITFVLLGEFRRLMKKVSRENHIIYFNLVSEDSIFFYSFPLLHHEGGWMDAMHLA